LKKVRNEEGRRKKRKSSKFTTALRIALTSPSGAGQAPLAPAVGLRIRHRLRLRLSLNLNGCPARVYVISIFMDKMEGSKMKR
jgi:hypothetical protein